MEGRTKNNKKAKVKNIGIEVQPPEKSCSDKNCPFHGTLKTHGRIFKGVVISSKAQKTATVRIKRLTYYRKYERYGKRDTKIHAHNPECIDAKKGDRVKIIETRPISKIKNFVIIEKVGREELPEPEEPMAEKPRDIKISEGKQMIHK